MAPIEFGGISEVPRRPERETPKPWLDPIRVGSAFERVSPVQRPFEIPAPTEIAEGMVAGAAKELGWQIARAAVEVASPGAGALVDGARAVMKAVEIGKSLAEGDGVRLTTTIGERYGFSLELGTTILAEHEAPLLQVEPTWSLRPHAENTTVEFVVEPGEAGRTVSEQPPVDLRTQWYDLEPSSLHETGACRAGLVDQVVKPGLVPLSTPTELTGLVVTAPTQEVLGASAVLSARAVVEYAERLGVVETDSTGARYLKMGSRGVLALLRRRRINVIAYVDQETGFVAVVELESGGAAAIRYLVLETEAVPDDIEARMLVRRLRPPSW